MLDELAIYNLSIKYPNTIDLVREVERIAKAEVIDELLHTMPLDEYQISFLKELKEQNK